MTKHAIEVRPSGRDACIAPLGGGFARTCRDRERYAAREAATHAEYPQAPRLRRRSRAPRICCSRRTARDLWSGPRDAVLTARRHCVRDAAPADGGGGLGLAGLTSEYRDVLSSPPAPGLPHPSAPGPWQDANYGSGPAPPERADRGGEASCASRPLSVYEALEARLRRAGPTAARR